ncbi:MAG: hypothetical protein ABSD89_14690 [Halobacteriota archaeon]
MESGGLALAILNHMERDWLQPSWLVEALYTGDHARLVPYFRQWVAHANLTSEHLARLLKMADPSFFRQSLQQLATPFKFHRGPKPKLPVSGYSRLLEKADLLRPAVTSLLTQLQQTTHGVPKILEYLRKDHPKACEFLLDRVNRLQLALNDPKVLRRAQKRISARARVLADAMAGTDSGLTFTTSMERVGEARRLTSKKSI